MGSDLIESSGHLRPILPAPRHLPRASTEGRLNKEPNKTGVRLWTADRARITSAMAPIRYAEIAVPGNDRKERVSESTRVITIGSSCAFSAQTLASMSSGA